MTDHPMLFNAPMVRALLEGRKTQTRRVMKGQPDFDGCPHIGTYHPTIVMRNGEEGPGEEVFGATFDEWAIKAPARPGDSIWVRETWGLNHQDYMTEIPKARPGDLLDYHLVHFATEDDPEILNEMPRRPSLHMPRWASRLTLVVTDVRAQRLQEISRADALAEGVQRVGGGALRWEQYSAIDGQAAFSPEAAFALLFNSINGPDSWEANPWVWALTFEVQQRNIDEVAA
ncbi:hypothetical protein [Gluconacetobacter asukensis]|uniref:Morphogenetic protein n=1 Tax=Gluconacetobacter asukensis TaxID=1017181 RepID=A0A7W4J198_9PROT|nr:hypothetical protein [Gluconacetobacter asukensis]MBB2172840.1 hypothetical protein [Gluconacetobacter asukensis]